MKKIILSLILALEIFTFSAGYATPSITAADLDYQCIGESLANYMNTVIDGAGGLPHILLLSPAFNMTNPQSIEIAKSMKDHGAKFDQLDGIAGNSYNLDGVKITEWVKKFMQGSGLSGKIFLTETGNYRTDDLTLLRSELSKIQSGSDGNYNYIAGLLFNAFNTNPGFSFQSLSTDQINQVCGGAGVCGRVGVNYATYYPQSVAVYSKAQAHGMKYTLEIATNDAPTIISALKAAHEKGATPVIRIGVGNNSGGFDDPQTYVGFLSQVNAGVDFDFYVIAGPNEPDLEPWANSNCGGEEPQRPLSEGFGTSTLMSCNQTVNSEFHPLRPYPRNACDPLIPQSVPPANRVPENKYITYSCGNALTPTYTEALDPRGINAQYRTIIRHEYGSDTGPYAHTVCDQYAPASGFSSPTKITCYRSVTADLNIDLKDSNLGILGNTQTGGLTDEQKVNEYLSYYFTGVPQISDHKIGVNPEEQARLVNFAGPVRKLLPWDLQNVEDRATTVQEGVKTENIHNYKVAGNKRLSNFSGHTPNSGSVEDITRWRYEDMWTNIVPNLPLVGDPLVLLRELFGAQKWWAKLYQAVTLASVEDTAGEFIISIFKPGEDEQAEEVVDSRESTFLSGLRTADAKIVIQEARLASGQPGQNITPASTYTAPPPETTNQTSCGTNLKILPFGDSITVGIDRSGTGNYSPGGYRGPLKDALVSAGFTVDLVGTSGENATLEMSSDSEHEGHGAQRASVLANIIDGALQSTNPNVVLVHAGTNNLTSDGIQEDIDSVESIIEKIRSFDPNITIFLAKILPIPAYSTTNTRDVPAYNNALQNFAGENVVIVDMNTGFPEDNLPDGIHPNKAGYEEMARRWAEAIVANCQ